MEKKKMEGKVEAQKLLDALTDHMSVYHMKKMQLVRVCSAKSDRQKVVDWLAGLHVKQRQAAFTVVDHAWVTLLLQMQEHLDREGPGSFFVLADFASRNGAKKHGNGGECSLPGLCFRRAKGLLRRLVSDGQPLLDNLRLYSSLDGETVKDSNEHLVHPKLDCMTLSYEVLEQVEALVEVMDKVSYGQFLEKQCLSGGSSWEETPWLKSMGYYSLAAFVANRLEISLWSAWVSGLGAKQPSKAIPRLLARNAVDTATLSSRQCAKRQGFEDWWNSLHKKDRSKVLDCALARTSRLEAADFGVYERQLTLPKCLLDNKRLGRAYVGIQLISESRPTLSERVVYSSLSQVHCMSERIHQAIRNILARVMKESVEHDLLNQVTNSATATKKVQVKRKGKGKKQKRSVVQRSCIDEEPVQSEKKETLRMPEIHNADPLQETEWIPGKKKKKNRRENIAKSEDRKQTDDRPQPALEMDENQAVDNTSIETPSAVEADPPERHETSETAQVNSSNHQHGAKARCQTNQTPGLPPYLKHHNQAFRPVLMSSPHEWPGASKTRFPVWDACARPAATEWLHLDVNRERYNHPKPPVLGYSSRQNGQLDAKMQRGMMSTYSWDWPPLVPTGLEITSPFGYTSAVDAPAPFSINRTPVQAGNDTSELGAEEDTNHPEEDDFDDYFDAEGDLRQLCDGDYNQYFGGGVMYWTSADYTGMGYSRPGSLSSEDSSWARREADLTVVVDDIVGLTPYPNLSSGASTMTCTSPSSASTVSFDHVAEVQNGLVAGTADILTYEHQPSLPPIAVRRSGGDATKLDGSKLHEARSPHVPRGRKEVLRWKRSPSPVLRCVPPAPPPPPPSPVAGIRKKKAFNAARSGSSSPRHWTVFNPLTPLPPEAFMSKGWRRFIPNTPVHPISGALLRERLIAIPSEQEHSDAAFPMQTSLLLKDNPAFMAKLLKEIEAFCIQVAAENAIRKPFVNLAVKKVTHALQVLWPRSRTRIFGSNATGLALPNSDVDLVVRLPPVRNLEPIKEAGILEGRNGIKETCLQHAARYLADQDWVKTDSLRTIENTAIPIIILVAKCFPEDMTALPSDPDDHGYSTWGPKETRHHVRLDISFESATHSGLHTATLIKELVSQFPAITPLALVLKQFLTDRGLDRPYTGGLSSYCLVLLITRFLQRHHHLGMPTHTQSLGGLLMDFLHFYGRVFDPRSMSISIRAGGKYISRDRLHGIDPLYVEDPLHPMNNVGRNCFRVLQCTKAFAEAYLTLEKELLEPSLSDELLLPKIIPSISAVQK